ncbi:MAG: TonB-dependent receptor plug domain-containing protein, partial [Vicinamibacterales bacterium]
MSLVVGHERRFGACSVLVCLLWVLALVSPISAQTRAAVRVTVTLQDGTPAHDVSVRVLNTGVAGTTDAAGALTFDAVPSGRYEIEAVLAGYAPATVRVRVASEAIDVALHLGPPVIAERVDVFGRADDGETRLKTPAPIAEIPYSVSIVPAARIELQKAQSLNEALRYTAGVQAEQYGGLDQAFDFLTIRGFGGSDVNGLFRDGSSLYTFGFNGFRIEPYGAESIQVLRGAASVLYGLASPGGIIDVVSKRPTASPLHEVTFEAGNYDYLQGKFDFSGPVSPSTPSVRYRLTGVVRNAKTQVDFQPNDRVFIAPALSWTGERTS